MAASRRTIAVEDKGHSFQKKLNAAWGRERKAAARYGVRPNNQLDEIVSLLRVGVQLQGHTVSRTLHCRESILTLIASKKKSPSQKLAQGSPSFPPLNKNPIIKIGQRSSN